jgi:AcrR family transcriptional regulator
MRRTSAKGEATASRLLDAALAAHAQAGQEGLTVQAVLDRSGVSLGSLYHHFRSANGLWAGLYDRCLGELLDAVLADVRRARTARGVVRAVVRSYLRFTREHADVARYVHASSYAPFLPDHGTVIATSQAERVRELRSAFEPHIAEQTVVALPLELLEVLVVGPVAEVARRWLAGEPLDLAAAERHLPERVWASVRGPAG